MLRSTLIPFIVLVVSRIITCHPDWPHDVTSQGFTKATPGGLEDVDATISNLLVGKSHVVASRSLNVRNLQIKLVNNFKDKDVKAYILGLDSAGKVFFAGPNSKVIYPNAKASRTPIEITDDLSFTLRPTEEPLSVALPPFVRSGRVYFSSDDLKFFVVDTGQGDSIVQPSVTNTRDPNAGVSWGFVELTYMDGLLYANISYVDFVGIVLGMTLVTNSGSRQVTAGLETNAVSKICNDLIKQGETDGRKWASLCIAGADTKPIRVLSPGNYHDLDSMVFENYWREYVNDVWVRYSTEDLVINTQSRAGMTKCRVVGEELSCDDNKSRFSKPDSKDVWGCNSGPFSISEKHSAVHTAIVPRLCAGFVRSTLLVNQGNVQPSLGHEHYYKVNTTNHYSRIVHSYEVDGKGYAFAYDDVNPDQGQDASGVVSSDNVNFLTIHAGGPLQEKLHL
jgi:hypothetical protein